MNHCGEKFHNEVAKFRFLNELIKVLSPKVSTWTWPARHVALVPHLQALSSSGERQVGRICLPVGSRGPLSPCQCLKEQPGS